MGKQISVQCAAYGYDVTLYDVDSDVLRRAKDEVAEIVNWLADSCASPTRLAALHFHFPVWTSNVVDLMPHPGTDSRVVDTLHRFALSIGQIPITYKKETHGYIFNSMFEAMQRQALDLVIGGVASIEDVDRAWMGIFKMPIGPFGMMDQASWEMGSC